MVGRVGVGQVSLSFSMHLLPWQAWAFSQQDILRLSLTAQWVASSGANVTKTQNEEAVGC